MTLLYFKIIFFRSPYLNESSQYFMQYLYLPSVSVRARPESPALHGGHLSRDGVPELAGVPAQRPGCTQLHVSPPEGDTESKLDINDSLFT